MSDTVIVEPHGEWVQLRLNRPKRLNCFNDDMHVALRVALEKARDDGARAVLLTGTGRAFCAGQDLADRDPATMRGRTDLGATLRMQYNPLIRMIRDFDAPVVCAVNGVAAGAGANLALACDIVLAAESARFIQSFAKVGLIPDAGGSWTLPHLVGEARAKGLALTGEPLDARRAETWGLIWKSVPDDRLLPEAQALTAELASGPTAGLSLTKKAIHTAASDTIDIQLEREAEYQARCGATPDYAEGVAAFLAKRAPQFRGRQ